VKKLGSEMGLSRIIGSTDWRMGAKRNIASGLTSEVNRPVRPSPLRTGTDDLAPSVRGQDGNGAVFWRQNGDGRKRQDG